MIINSNNGIVTLPNGIVIGPELTQDVFQHGFASANAQSQEHGTLPWIHYSLSGGQIDDKELLVSICFYDHLLVYVNLSVDLYPPGQRDWSHYSLDVEAQTKDLHDALLERILGKPTVGIVSDLFDSLRQYSNRVVGRKAPAEADSAETLHRPRIWKYFWGQVDSGHDWKGGGTSIIVSYGNRREEANRDYNARRIGVDRQSTN